MNEQFIGQEDREKQQAISNQAPTIEERGNPGGIPVEVAQDRLEPSFEDEPEVAQEVEVTTVEEAVQTVSTVLQDMIGNQGDTFMVSLNVSGELNFCLDLFNDEVNALLDANSSIVIGDQKYNVIQPLGKYNKKTDRIGLLTETVRTVAERVKQFDDLSGNVIMPVGHADDFVTRLLTAKRNALTEEMYSRFGSVENGGEPVLDFDSGFRVSLEELFALFMTVRVGLNTQAEVPEVTVNVNAYVHLRVPMVLRSEADKVERTLIRHVQYLHGLIERNGLKGEVYAIMRNGEMFEAPIWSLLDVIRSLYPNVIYNRYYVIPSEYSDGDTEVAHIGDFPGTALFHNGDFAIRLERDGEDETADE